MISRVGGGKRYPKREKVRLCYILYCKRVFLDTVDKSIITKASSVHPPSLTNADLVVLLS